MEAVLTDKRKPLAAPPRVGMRMDSDNMIPSRLTLKVPVHAAESENKQYNIGEDIDGRPRLNINHNRINITTLLHAE